MKLLLLVLSFSVVLLQVQGQTGTANDLLDVERVPNSKIVIKYGDKSVTFGNELTPTQVKDPPSDIRWPVKPKFFFKEYFTLMMLDPDLPSRAGADPTQREGLHWLVINIPNLDMGAGETFAEYIGAGPNNGTGLHRYIFLVYKQKGNLSLNRAKVAKNSLEGRMGFKARDFAKDNRLGTPVASNYFQAQWDDYVPTLHSQFTG